MNTLRNIVDLNSLFGESSNMIYKCINYWSKQVCDEMKFKYPKEIINIEYKIINSITSIEIDFAINDSKFVYAIELNLNVDDLPTTKNMVDRIMLLYKE